MKKAHCVIYRSENGRDNWEPVMFDSVPEWVKDPVVMGRLIAGEQCMDAGEGDTGSAWYKAIRAVSQVERDMVIGALGEVRTVH